MVWKPPPGMGDPGPSTIAAIKPFSEFLEYFEDKDINATDRFGETALYGAVCNSDPDERYRRALWLLERGADASIGSRDCSILHALIQRMKPHKPWFEQDVELLQRLLDAGADVNRSVSRDGRVLSQLCHSLNPRRLEHKHVFDMFFARDDLDFKAISKRTGESYAAWIIRSDNSYSKKSKSPLEGWIRAYLARQGHSADEVDAIINTRGIYADED